MSVALVALVLALVAPASAEERQRLDVYGPDGRREGYATLDPQTGRVDVYDRDGRRTGFGRIMPRTGDQHGRRQHALRLGPGTPTPTR